MHWLSPFVVICGSDGKQCTQTKNLNRVRKAIRGLISNDDGDDAKSKMNFYYMASSVSGQDESNPAL